MDLWIRSQDKRGLIKAIYFGLDNVLNTGEVGIKGYFSENKYKILGYYKNEKRALEVLDEIQHSLLDGAFAKLQNGLGETKNFIPNPTFVYKMPEE